ncbi:MAG: hypothetical protein ABSH08_19155 [Tepidisphaeraceae bacterium]|jgi:hypothetical protein
MLEYDARRPRYRPTPEDRVWLLYRLGWYGFQLLLLLAIVYRIGPNLFLFHSPFSPRPEDFVSYTNEYVPIIAAIKAYNRDFGKLPFDSDLPPEYMPRGYKGVVGEIVNTTSITFPLADHIVLEYEFSPAMEGWIVHSPRYDGRIPAPIVPAAPKPVTRPSSSPLPDASHAK